MHCESLLANHSSLGYGQFQGSIGPVALHLRYLVAKCLRSTGTKFPGDYQVLIRHSFACGQKFFKSSLNLWFLPWLVMLLVMIQGCLMSTSRFIPLLNGTSHLARLGVACPYTSIRWRMLHIELLGREGWCMAWLYNGQQTSVGQ